MTNKHYILDDDMNIVVEPDILKWAAWFEHGNRVVKQERVRGIFVSTVFLGIDHNFGDGGDPVLFETMVFRPFGRGGEVYMTRSSTLMGAITDHVVAVRMAKLNFLRWYWQGLVEYFRYIPYRVRTRIEKEKKRCWTLKNSVTEYLNRLKRT